jgi:peptidoglycan hydrolase-like protein with peptidoglycan-binding domain
MKPLIFLAALACLPATASADDRIRDVQGLLKAQGFYYGDVTGAENAETGAAIRRFQIRSGITVTGKLNADTLVALGLGEKKPASPAPQPAALPKPAPAPAKPAAPAPANLPPAAKQLNPAAPPELPPLPARAAMQPRNAPDAGAEDTAPRTAQRGRVTDPAIVDPPSPVPAPVSSPFTIMFRDTPYANAPRDVQMATVRRAQTIMAARRHYRGPLDGIAGPATSEAIFLFQAEADLPRTGRLDLDTLAEMKLLPQSAPGNPLLKPFYNPNRHRDRSVLSE